MISSMAPMAGAGASQTMLDAYSSDNAALAHAEYREDTAIDRELAALERNGINPILGFTGNGASSAASSANVSGQASIKSQKIASLIGIVSSAMSLAAGIPGLSTAYHGTNIGFRK